MKRKLERLEAFIAERLALSDWGRFISFDQAKLNRRLVCEQCGFSRSIIYQNPDIKDRLAELENELRRGGVLKNPHDQSVEENSALDLDVDMRQQFELLEKKLEKFLYALQATADSIESFHPKNEPGTGI